RTERSRRSAAQSHAILRTQNCRLDPLIRVANPRGKLRPGNAYQAAGSVQPERALVVFEGPHGGIARQTVLAAQRNDAPVLEPAHASHRRDPQHAILEPKIGDLARSEPVGRRVGRAHPPVLEIRHATAAPKSQPQPSALRVGKQYRDILMTSETRPWDPLDQSAIAQVQETLLT